MIVTGSNRQKDVMQIFSLSKHQLVSNFDYEVTRKDLESGYVLGTRFSQPHPDLIFAGGAGRNELKIFENNVDGSGSMRIMATLNEFDSAVLSVDVSKNGESFCMGCQNGNIYVMSYKIDDLAGDFEGYQDGFSVIEKPPVTAAHNGSKLNRKDISEELFEESKKE